jgi:hypothetical protein
MVDKIENFMNVLTDMDWGWWPALFLRPQKDKDIDNSILLKMSLVFGSIVGLFYSLIAYLRSSSLTFGVLIFSFLSGWVLFFVVYKVTFAYFWNRRARRLRGE